MRAKLIKEAFYDERVKRNTRKKLKKMPGIFHDQEEEDEYMDRYEDSHGVPMSSRKMARNVKASVLNDRGEVMEDEYGFDDVYGFGDNIVNAYKRLGLKAEVHGYGRTKDGMPNVGLDIDIDDPNSSLYGLDEIIFSISKKGNLMCNGSEVVQYKGERLDNLDDLTSILDRTF